MAITTPDAVPGEVIEAAWGDAVRADLTALDTNKVSATGDTMTGSLTMSGGATVAGLPTPTVDGWAAPKSYVDTKVDKAGDTMTGNLNVGNPAVTGILAQTSGQMTVRYNLTSGTGSPNVALDRTGTQAVQAGEPFIRFLRSAATIGRIEIATASSVSYVTTSDARLKERTGDVADATELVRQLGGLAYRGRWIADEGGGEEWVFLNSQDVEVVAPYAVSGAPDAVVGADDPDGRAEGEVEPQGLDAAALVPLLFAALAQAIERIDALEGGASP